MSRCTDDEILREVRHHLSLKAGKAKTDAIARTSI